METRKIVAAFTAFGKGLARKKSRRSNVMGRRKIGAFLMHSGNDWQEKNSEPIKFFELCRKDYFAAFTIAMPHGPSPTLIRRNSLRDFTSTTETSFDAPFAV